MSVLKVIAGAIVIYVITVAASFLYRYIILIWHWYKVKKAGADLQKCMDNFFSNLSPRESEFCGDCKYSYVSNNNGNLICLNEKSRHFGEAIRPETDKGEFCYFEREDKAIKSVSENLLQ